MPRVKKQNSLPGMEPKTDKELDTLAEAYVKARNERMTRTTVEKDAKDALIAGMRRKKLSAYRDDSAGLVVTIIEGKDGVKVTDADEKDDGDDQEDAA